MKYVLSAIVLAITLVQPLWAADGPPPVNPDTNHHSEADTQEIGRPGRPDDVTRTIEVRLYDTQSGRMIFEPRGLYVKTGTTVRFKIVNVGLVEHEFFVGNPHQISEHRKWMQDNPDMEHSGPNSVSLQRGQSGEVLWAFDTPGPVDFACLVPGHFEAGMRGLIIVNDLPAFGNRG
ncbi:cupredoxin domain-containing protein [Sulfitobacter sp. MF3-043]|uniref:cupredoxin domain-containing protein n=1 Tax=Sulfitobacter sediminivivens TaxID=3252902 RepID=UPI0036D8D3F9